jgi:hypothetical protein
VYYAFRPVFVTLKLTARPHPRGRRDEGPQQHFNRPVRRGGRLEFKTDISNLMDRMRNVFAEYQKTIRLDDGVLSAVNTSGHVFPFASKGRHAALVIGRENPDAARKLLEAATKQTR